MEAIENKSRYLRRETRRQKVRRILRKFFWLFPLLAIALGLLIAWQLIRNIQAESTFSPAVDYGEYVRPAKKAKKESGKLEQYRERMRQEKEEKSSSRYQKIISGSELVGKLNFGQAVPAENTNPDSVPEEPAVPLQEAAETERPATTSGNRAVLEQPPPAGKKKQLPLSSESAAKADSLQKPADPFFTLKVSDSGLPLYTRAHFYGDQDILSGAYIRLRLGEDMRLGGKVIPRNTVFRGTARLSRNKIEISIEQIGTQKISGMVCDQDYNPGIVIPASRQEEMEEAVRNSLYRSGTGSMIDLPYEIIQDVSRNMIRNRRRKQSTIRISDDYLVYITQNQP